MKCFLLLCEFTLSGISMKYDGCISYSFPCSMTSSETVCTAVVFVMLHVIVRYLVKSYQQAVSGLPLATSVSYLATKSTVSSLDSSLSVDALTDAYRHRAARHVLGLNRYKTKSYIVLISVVDCWALISCNY